MTTTMITDPMVVAQGTESAGDRHAQLLRERAAAANWELRQRAERALTHGKSVVDDLFDGRHTSLAADFMSAVTTAQGLFDDDRFDRVPSTVYRALAAAEAAVYQAESGQLGEMIEELAAWPALGGLVIRARNLLERTYRLVAGSKPQYRQAIGLVRQGIRLVDRELDRSVLNPAPAKGDPTRAKRESERRARQLERSVGPKGPSNKSEPNSKNGKRK